MRSSGWDGRSARAVAVSRSQRFCRSLPQLGILVLGIWVWFALELWNNRGNRVWHLKVDDVHVRLKRLGHAYPVSPTGSLHTVRLVPQDSHESRCECENSRRQSRCALAWPSDVAAKKVCFLAAQGGSSLSYGIPRFISSFLFS